MGKFILLAMLLIAATSCRSGWSCQKRYVTTPKPYNFKKHHVIKNFDKMMIEKYATKVTKP